MRQPQVAWRGGAALLTSYAGGPPRLTNLMQEGV
jgi:hypothetical protein